jgi:hypothetical protein
MALTREQKEGIKWAVWIATIIIGGLIWVTDESKDNAKYEALMDVTIPEIRNDQKEIMKTLEKHEDRWMEQAEWAGGVNAYFRIDIKQPGP